MLVPRRALSLLSMFSSLKGGFNGEGLRFQHVGIHFCYLKLYRMLFLDVF